MLILLKKRRFSISIFLHLISVVCVSVYDSLLHDIINNMVALKTMSLPFPSYIFPGTSNKSLAIMTYEQKIRTHTIEVVDTYDRAHT